MCHDSSHVIWHDSSQMTHMMHECICVSWLCRVCHTYDIWVLIPYDIWVLIPYDMTWLIPYDTHDAWVHMCVMSVPCVSHIWYMSTHDIHDAWHSYMTLIRVTHMIYEYLWHAWCVTLICVLMSCVSLMHDTHDIHDTYVNASSHWWHAQGIPQHAATHCNTLQHTATHCNTLQHTATHCNTLQHAATHCNTLQHTCHQWLDAFIYVTWPHTHDKHDTHRGTCYHRCRQG